MSSINIRRDVSDKHYRYKMPRLISKIEGKGNGIKTVIPNMSDIAKALSRPPTYTTKFFGCELGAQVKCDDKNDRYIVNGAHDADKLQTLLDGFITRFVLCGSCKNPETDLIIKGDDITKNCLACGAQTDVDIRHKLCVFIVKNPPITKKSKGDKKAKAHATTKGAGSLATPTDTASNGSGEEEDGLQFDIGDVPEAPANGSNTATLNGEEDDDDWGQDTSAAAVAERMKALAVGGAVKKLNEAGDDDEDEGDDPLEQFAEFVTTHATNDDEIIAKAAELSIRDDKVCAVLPQVLFNAKVLAEKQIPARAKLLRRFLKSEKCQKGLLGGLERLVGVNHPAELMAKVPLVLKAVYDEDLVEEEVLLAWGEKASKKFVDRKVAKEIRAKAEPFLKWLKEAEEEDDDDEDEDDE
ncbi:hypothetical protein HDU96_000874 [Phlyctochytrium bullatum]|nr:hypothetical protein HDU96_000874 [Phlyctochytrium bullatum]